MTGQSRLRAELPVHADKFCKVEISDEIPERKQHQRAAADPNAATRRSVAKATSSLARTAMAAVCVAAIWAASAASISSFGFAASIIASEAFMESSEIPPKGERHADCIWNNEAFTKSLDVVPRALFSRRHQFSPSPSGGWTLASLPSAPTP
jgi:hypothetical protein